MPSIQILQSTIQLRNLSNGGKPVDEHNASALDSEFNKMERSLRMPVSRMRARRTSTVIGHSNRCLPCNKILVALDLVFSLLSSTATFGYLVLFSHDVSPNTYIAMVIFVLLRFMLVALGSYGIYVGLKQELVRTLVLLGTDISRCKTTRDMIQNVQEGDDQLLILS